MIYQLTAQPIDGAGRIGFEQPPPEAEGGVLQTEAKSLAECFASMAELIERVQPKLDEELEFGGEDPAWDLTLVQGAP